MRVYRTVTTTDSGGPSGSAKLRGAQCWSLTSNTITFRALLEQNIPGWLSCPRSFAPGMVTGDPAALCVEGDGASSYQIVTVHETTFADCSGSNDSVSVGAFHCGRIPDSLSGEKPVTAWWSGHLSERSAGYWRG